MQPGLVFADDLDRFRRALENVCPPGVELVSTSPSEAKRATPFDALERIAPGGALDTAHASVGAETIAKILYTSGSTGVPKGVINTQQDVVCQPGDDSHRVATARRRAADPL